MSKVDWSKAPDGAEWFAGDHFYRNVHGAFYFLSSPGFWQPSLLKSVDELRQKPCFEQRPQQWPDESRIDTIGTNGNDGEHYMKVYPLNETKTVQADEILSEGLQILTQRGEQYGSEQRECSFPQAAEAFNALTGHNIKGSDVCLILALVKQVRQHAQDRYHHDSAVDGVNYLALQAQELAKERKQLLRPAQNNLR